MSQNNKSIGPTLPPSRTSKGETENVYIGPALPPSFQKNELLEESGNPSTETVYIGPALPPEFKTSAENNLYGPTLPPDFTTKPPATKKKKVIGPALPPGFSLPATPVVEDIIEDEEEEYIGPSLTEFHSSDSKATEESVSKSIEARAKKMKDKLLCQEEEIQKRDAWMTQLPDFLGKKIGLGARTFSKRSGPSASEVDRSGWTETPLDKERKETQADEPDVEEYIQPTPEEIAKHSRNLNIHVKIDEFNKTKRKESLLDIHQKNLKRKSKEEKGKTEKRREFDRDKDLNIQHVDRDGAKNIIGGSKVFNSKFSHGSSHFL